MVLLTWNCGNLAVVRRADHFRIRAGRHRQTRCRTDAVAQPSEREPRSHRWRGLRKRVVYSLNMPTYTDHPHFRRSGLGWEYDNSRRLLAAGCGVDCPRSRCPGVRFGLVYIRVRASWIRHSLLFARCGAAGRGRMARVSDELLRACGFLFIATACIVCWMPSPTRIGCCVPVPCRLTLFFVASHEVSPLTLSRFLSERGAAVLKSELLWCGCRACCSPWAGANSLATERRQRPA